MESVFDGLFKNFVQEPNTVILLHLHRFAETLLNPKSLTPTLDIFGNFSIFWLVTNLCSGACL